MKIKIPITFELTEDQFEKLVKQTKWFNEKIGQDLTPQEYFCWIMMVDNNVEFFNCKLDAWNGTSLEGGIPG